MVRTIKMAGQVFEPKLNLWVYLPHGVNSQELYERCREKKVLFSPGTFYFNDERGENYIRMSFATTDINDIWDGISIISMEAENIKHKH